MNLLDIQIKFNPGDKVRIKKYDQSYEGVIDSIATGWEIVSDVFYWVNYEVNPETNCCNLFPQEKLLEWNRGGNFPCTCGAQAVGVLDNEVNRHSWHCQLVKG